MYLNMRETYLGEYTEVVPDQKYEAFLGLLSSADSTVQQNVASYIFMIFQANKLRVTLPNEV